MRIISFVFLFLILLVGIAFASLNAEPITLNYFVGSSHTPLSWSLFGALGIGSLLGLLAAITIGWRLKRENARLLHRLKLAEKEVENLRVMPLKDSH
jgi:lipopolysaccharide assembly protein A